MKIDFNRVGSAFVFVLESFLRHYGPTFWIAEAEDEGYAYVGLMGGSVDNVVVFAILENCCLPRTRHRQLSVKKFALGCGCSVNKNIT